MFRHIAFEEHLEFYSNVSPQKEEGFNLRLIWRYYQIFPVHFSGRRVLVQEVWRVWFSKAGGVFGGQARKQGVRLVPAPRGLSISKRNSSTYQTARRRIHWRVEWKFSQLPNSLVSRCVTPAPASVFLPLPV
jgi:hypothetical protein